MEFKASYDTLAKIVTGAVIALFLGFLGYGCIAGFGNEFIGAAILGFTLIVCGIYAPTKYSITPNSILIHRLIGAKSIKRSDIIAAEIVPQKQIRFSMRTFGVGGLFGYFGKFYNTDFGTMNWFLTRKDQTVLITTKTQKKFLISPDEIDRFIATLKL